MKKNHSIKKYIAFLIVLLIPMIAATLIGIYSYNRYQDRYFYEYMESLEEDSQERVLGYIKYANILYEQEPFYTEDAKKGDERVLTIDVYRAVSNLNKDGTISDEEKLFYYFVVYNINYTKLIEIEDPTGERDLIYNDIPSIFLTITDKNDSENTITEMFGTISARVYVKDYNSSPEKDSKGNQLTTKYVKWFLYEVDDNYSSDLSFELIVSDNPKDDLSPGVITTFDLELEHEVDDIDTSGFAKGHENDIFKAGYFAHVLKTKMWWQVLIAFAIVGIISFSFYGVWNAEQNMKKGKK